MSRKHKIETATEQGPMTGAEKQALRYVALKAAATKAGWSSWAQFATAVINGRVELPRAIKDGDKT